MSVCETAAMPVISLFHELLGLLTIRHEEAQAVRGRVVRNAAPSFDRPAPRLRRSATLPLGSAAGVCGFVAAAAGTGTSSAEATSAARNSREAGLRTPTLMAGTLADN